MKFSNIYKKRTFLLGCGSCCNRCAVGESVNVNLGLALSSCDTLCWSGQSNKLTPLVHCEQFLA